MKIILNFTIRSQKIETVIPHEDGKIAMYTCGPTVYHFAHIGNLRSYVSWKMFWKNHSVMLDMM